MTFIPDSQLVDSVLVAEAYDRQGAPILGAVIHMAEGGGTDTWLTRIDGNSSHYVIKYSGKLVQLVPESKAAGSMNPRLTRTGNDKAFTQAGVSIQYGRAALDAVLGAYAPIYVNRAVIAIEIEGFASDGLNAAQTVTLVSLIKDIRNRRGPVGLLGHRDQQDYKACPGKFIPWNLLGGHGPAATEDDMPPIDVTPAGTIYAYIIRVATKVGTYGPAAGDRGSIGPKADGSPWVGNALGVYGIDGLGGKRAFMLPNRAFVLESAVEATKNERDTADDCTDEVAAAVAAAKASARVVFG